MRQLSTFQRLPLEPYFRSQSHLTVAAGKEGGGGVTKACIDYAASQPRGVVTYGQIEAASRL